MTSQPRFQRPRSRQDEPRQTQPQQTQSQPLVTFAIPCHNSEEYLDRCLMSVLDDSGRDRGPSIGRDIEVIVVDDGSTDGTLALAQGWQRLHPQTIRVIHQENRGHGGAINAALSRARGTYFKVVDSDDWLDPDALDVVLARLAGYRQSSTSDPTLVTETLRPPDLLFTNYVYEHLSDGTRRVVDYRDQFPGDRVFTWDETGGFPKWKFLMMHSFVCRTQLLRDEGIFLPEHMSYDDEVLVYEVLPEARLLAYADCDLYRYATGRPGQSVADDALARHASDQVRVCRMRIDDVRIPDDVPSERLEAYLLQDLGFSMVFATLACTMAGDKRHINEKDELWQHLRDVNPALWRRIRYGFFGFWCFLPGRLGEKAFLDGYHLASYAYKLN